MGIFRERFKTLKDVFELATEERLFKLITEGAFEGLESPISIGKEANIFTAVTKRDERVIVKIYRLATSDFNQMYQFLRVDPRFPGVKRNRRQVVFTWAQREYRNLLQAREAGVRVPTPLAINGNALVMEYIGGESPAPKLKDEPPADPTAYLDDLIANLRKLHKAGMVHGDLSPFNILTWNGKPVLIDLSQATSLQNPNATVFLQRDCRVIAKHFRKLGVDIDGDRLLEAVTAPDAK
jgi:RIO kinase 1